MSIKGCSGISKDKYLSKSERAHKEYCEDKSTGYSVFNTCSRAEGCKIGKDENGEEKCLLNVGDSLSNAYINGGIGFGKLCLSREFTRVILLLLFPPLYVFLNERENDFKNKSAILMSFILTCIFYFPGLIYTLMYKQHR